MVREVDEMSTLDKELSIHAELVELYGRFTARKVLFRRIDRAARPEVKGNARAYVDRDRVICALLNKAANTKRAILVLANEHLGVDAMALARVHMENVVQLCWMLLEDWPERVDTYWLFWTIQHIRTGQVLSEFLPQSASPQGRPAPEKAVFDISRTLYEDKRLVWARLPSKTYTLKDMFESVVPEGGPRVGNRAYSVLYFLGSQAVHSVASSLVETMEAISRDVAYSLKERDSDRLTLVALQQSNVWMWAGLTAVARFVGVDMEEDFEKIHELIKA